MEITTELAKYSPTDEAIATLAGQYMQLSIRDVNDTVGYKAVHTARAVVKDYRILVERVRKELKADALEYGRKVDAEAKRITALLEPIESHLIQQEDAYEAEKERIKNAARLKTEAEAKAKAEAEEAQRRAEQEAEMARMRAERAELDAERVRQKAEQDRIDAERRAVEAEQKRLADIDAARLRTIEMENAWAESAEKARVETEARLAREAAAKEAAEKAKAAAEEAARLRAEALRPDREKLLSVAAAVAAIEVPAVSADASEPAKSIQQVLLQAAARIKSIVAYMEG